MIVKICGMREPENMKSVDSVRPNFIGMIFAGESPRVVTEKVVGTHATKVGVFVNPTFDEIMQKASLYDLNVIQLHGSESPELCKKLKSLNYTVFKAISVAETGDLQNCSSYEECCDMFVFDTKTPLHGGSGEKFDWEIIRNYNGRTPFLLSGGIGEEDVECLKKFVHDKFMGVDINSRFETSAAVKDVEKVRRFVNKLRTTK